MRSNLSVTRVVGRSSRTAAQVTGIGRGSRWRRHRAAWRLIRNAVASSRQSCRAGLIRTFGSPGRFAENGRSVVTCPRSGFATPGVTTRRLADNSKSWLFSNAVVGDRSFDRPSNTQMEPSRPTVVCDPVAAARGSFATLGIKGFFADRRSIRLSVGGKNGGTGYSRCRHLCPSPSGA